LVALSKLISLDLRRNEQVTARGIASVPHLTSLIAGSNTSDEHLAALPNLTSVDLTESSNITVGNLLNLSHLKHLVLGWGSNRSLITNDNFILDLKKKKITLKIQR
jgi:hypothetical protein